MLLELLARIVAWSWWKDDVTSTYCHMCHVHSVYRTRPQSQTQTHIWTQLTLLTAHQLNQPFLPLRTSAGVTLTAFIHVKTAPIHTGVCPTHSHVSAITAQTCIRQSSRSSSPPFFCPTVCFQCSTQWHVPFFCFFFEFGYWCHAEKNTKTCFQSVKGGGVEGEHNIIQGRRLRNTAGGSSRHPTSS